MWQTYLGPKCNKSQNTKVNGKLGANIYIYIYIYIYITIGEWMKRAPILLIMETKLCICATRLLLIRS